MQVSTAETDTVFSKDMILASLTVLAQKKRLHILEQNWLVFLHVIIYLKIALFFLHVFEFIFLD